MKEKKELGLNDLKNQPMDATKVQEVDPIALKGKKKVEEKNILFEDAFGALNSVTDRIKAESDRFLEEKREYEIEEEINSDLDDEEKDELDELEESSNNEEVIKVVTNSKTTVRVMERETEKEDDEEEKEEEKDERDKQFEQLQTELKKKVNPIKNKIDLNSFKISKRPVTVSNALKSAASQIVVADWALFNRKRAITLSEFSGTEINKLNPENSLTNVMNTYKDIYKLIYDHVIDANKPKNMEEWLKTIYYKDRDHLYFAIYKASFARSNYIPYECTECKHVFVTEDIKIEDMVKYKLYLKT